MASVTSFFGGGRLMAQRLVSPDLRQGFKQATAGRGGAPQPVSLSLDRHDHLIEIASLGKLAACSAPELKNELRTEFRRLFRYRLKETSIRRSAGDRWRLKWGCRASFITP